jgi:integrase
MSVRKRTWTSDGGKRGEAWVVDYVDQAGKRHLRAFDKKKGADGFHDTVRMEVRDGIHTADSDSKTVADAGALWLANSDQYGLERSTIAEYRRIVDRYIVPHIGHIKLSRLNAPTVQAFVKRLMSGPDGNGDRLSPSLARRIKSYLGMLIADAQEHGLVARNVVRGSKRQRRGGSEDRGSRLEAGVEFPTPKEVRALLEASEGRAKALLMVATFTGLRASELRGLRWEDIDFRKSELTVRQRADRYHKMGPPKSKAGNRKVPIPPLVLASLREWKLACPKGNLDLVFPTSIGTIESHQRLVFRLLAPTMVAAKVVRRTAEGEIVPKYTGLHSLRHFFASWCINRKVDGGLELPPKVVQERLGHATIAMTLDRYGHLFPRGDDSAELAAAERTLLGR